MIDQLTVFLGNTEGRLTALCKALGNAGIQMHALTLADTADYGLARIVCDNPQAALAALSEGGFAASLAKVVAVEVPNVPGGLAQVTGVFDGTDLNIEYCYCFADARRSAIVALKTAPEAVQLLEDAGLHVLHPADLYAE